MPHEKDGKVQLFINIVSITTVLGTVSAQKKKLEWERSVGMRKKEIIVIYNNMDKSQKGSIEQMSDTQKIHFFIPFIEVSNRSHRLIVVGISTLGSLREDSWERSRVLFLDLSAGYMGVFTV